jgi:hypothetical protein
MTGRTARVWSSAVPAPVLWRDAGCLQIPVFPILGHVPVSTLYKHWREWQLTAYRVGRTLKFRERDSEAWLERQPYLGTRCPQMRYVVWQRYTRGTLARSVVLIWGNCLEAGGSPLPVS